MAKNMDTPGLSLSRSLKAKPTGESTTTVKTFEPDWWWWYPISKERDKMMSLTAIKNSGKITTNTWQANSTCMVRSQMPPWDWETLHNLSELRFSQWSYRLLQSDRIQQCVLGQEDTWTTRPWKWGQHDPSKRRKSLAQRHSVISQTTRIFPCIPHR
jgi:hypothetical protein